MPARITKVSPISGRKRTMEFSKYEQLEFDRRYSAWSRKDVLIQDAFPDLSPEAREFIMTGITEEEWIQVGVDNNANNTIKLY